MPPFQGLPIFSLKARGVAPGYIDVAPLGRNSKKRLCESPSFSLVLLWNAYTFELYLSYTLPRTAETNNALAPFQDGAFRKFYPPKEDSAHSTVLQIKDLSVFVISSAA